MAINCQYLEKLSVSGKLGRAWGVSRLSFSGWIQIELMVMTLGASVQSLCPAKHLIRKVSEPPKVKESQKVKQRIIAMSCYIRKFANSLTIISLRGVKYKSYQSLLPKHSPPHSSLSQVCQTQSRVAKSGYMGSSIHSESGHQPPTMSLPLSVFSFLFLSRVSPLWQDCGQVGVQVCPLIHNDRWPLSLLPGDSVLAGLTGRASCTSGRQGTGQTRCPGGVTEERSAIAMYREIIS